MNLLISFDEPAQYLKTAILNKKTPDIIIIVKWNHINKLKEKKNRRKTDRNETTIWKS